MARSMLAKYSIVIATALCIPLVVFCVLSEADVLHIQYLSPLAHYIAIAVAPIIPFIAPIYLGSFLKVWTHEPWPKKKLWLLLTANWTFIHVGRVVNNVTSLYKGRSQCGGVLLCGAWECLGAWVEETMLLVVIICSWKGWRWDGGVLDKWIESLVQAEKDSSSGEGERIDNEEKGVAAEVVGGEESVLLLTDEKKAIKIEA